MAQTATQLTLFVTFHIKHDLIEKFKEAHRPVWAACAEEPECLLFDVFQDPGQPGRFRFVEVWNASREWFENVQLRKPYYEDLWAKSKPTWESEMKIEYFERLGEGFAFKKGYLKTGDLTQ
ncbi:hypothetical protein diail_11918 [Diaporthe ilicicola]|nr:hypothetical protein diail_11918 [Diaporthe ilicicola]